MSAQLTLFTDRSTPVSSAVISACGLYRYELWRRWTEGPACLFIGLNPSTADASKDDPTIRKCIGFSKRWGFAGLCMVNLFAYRATNPREMLSVSDPVGPENDSTLQRLSSVAGRTIAAWGKDGSFRGRDAEVAKFFGSLHCLKLNKDGSPQHPLYVSYQSTIITYEQ